MYRCALDSTDTENINNNNNNISMFINVSTDEVSMVIVKKSRAQVHLLIRSFGSFDHKD